MTKKKESKTLTEFKINRRTWLRGTGVGCLLDSNGKMCCLGHLSRAFGVPKSALRKYDHRVVEPSEIENVEDYKLPEWLINSCGAFVIENDVDDISDDVREDRLIKLFAKKKIKLTFTGRKS